MPLISVGLVIAGVGTFLSGRRLNVTGPTQKIEAALSARRQEIAQAISLGRFAPDGIMPTSRQEAEQIAAEVLELEQLQLRNSMYNRHTLYFIPMQYFGFIWIGLGVFVALSPLLNR